MKVGISGTHDGVPWPPPGGEVDLPEAAALKLLRNDQAEVSHGGPREERAVLPDDSERRALDLPPAPTPPKPSLTTDSVPTVAKRAGRVRS